MSDTDPRDYRSLGDLLRDAREEKKLSFEELNEATRISVRVLQAMEQDDLEGASGLVYMRGFVRTLASFHDLDPEWLGAKLDALADETSRPVMPVDGVDEVIAGPVADPVEEEVPEETGPKWEVESTRIRHVGSGSAPRVSRNLLYGLVAVLVLAIALVWWVGRDSGSDGSSTRNPGVAGTEVASLEKEPDPGSSSIGEASPQSAEPPAAPPTTASEEISAVEDPVSETAAVVEEESPGGFVGEIDARMQDSGVEPAPEDPAPRRMVEVEDSSSPAGGGLSSVIRPAEGESSRQMELVVRADGPVEVTLSADGGQQETRFLQAGELWTSRGSDHFSIAVSDPAAVTLRIDGEACTLPASWSGGERILYPSAVDGGER